MNARESAAPVLSVRALRKSFVLHQRGGVALPVLDGVDLEVHAGECVVIDGPSGTGKSTLLKLVHANYRASGGSIRVRAVDDRVHEIVGADERLLVHLRDRTIGYVSQFLRAVPRVPALDVVAEPLVPRGGGAQAWAAAREQAAAVLRRLDIPERLWPLPPATFSGGEQQRVNVARGLIRPVPLLLLDEPTASLDRANAATVVELIGEAVGRGGAVLGVFHDAAVARAVATRRLPMRQVEPA